MARHEGPVTTVLGKLCPVGGGESIALTQPRLLIGRTPPSDIIIRSNDLAPVHCRLYVEGSAWFVRSISIERETKVNAIAVIEMRLEPGDILSLSSTHTYRVQYDAEALAGHRVVDR